MVVEGDACMWPKVVPFLFARVSIFSVYVVEGLDHHLESELYIVSKAIVQR